METVCFQRPLHGYMQWLLHRKGKSNMITLSLNKGILYKIIHPVQTQAINKIYEISLWENDILFLSSRIIVNNIGRRNGNIRSCGQATNHSWCIVYCLCHVDDRDKEIDILKSFDLNIIILFYRCIKVLLCPNACRSILKYLVDLYSEYKNTH